MKFLFLLAALPLALVAATPLPAQAGDVTPQVVGGTETSPGSRPYQVALLMNGRQGCGGTLISPDWVLTAAHCLDSASTATLTVQVGAHRMSPRDGSNHRVSQIIKHENWRGASGIQSGWDIAVLRLATPAAANIKPAKLPTVEIERQIGGVGAYVTVSGWGLTRNGGSPSNVLREVALPVLSNSACSSELGTGLPASVICGGGPNGTSACNGDSGGPFASSSGGNFYSLGTVSWGRSCRGATVFTRTTSYLAWIEQKTGVKPDTGLPNDTPPVANFDVAVSGLTASFTDRSSDDKGISLWSWNFGNGQSSTQRSPSHAYLQNGTYTVTLTVTDTANQSTTLAKSVTVGSSGGCSGIPAWSASTQYAIGQQVSYAGVKYQASWWSLAARPDIYSNVWTRLGPC